MKRIAELRKEKGLNQTGLGLKLNVSQKMISAYESGIHQPSIETLIQMSKFFNVSVDYLIGLSDTRRLADEFSSNRLTSKEIELLDVFKELNEEEKLKAIGMLMCIKLK